MSNSSDNRDIAEAVRTLAWSNKTVFDSFAGTVTAVNLTENTCTVEPLDGGADYNNIVLSVNESKGFLLIPRVGSMVMVIKTSDFTGYIGMVSDVDQVYINGDNQGGLVKVVDLVTKLNNLENKVNSLITTFNSWVVVPGDGGAALKAVLSAWVATSLTPTVRANIENVKVKHGS